MLRRMPLVLVLMLIGCATSAPVLEPVPKPPNVTVSESSNSRDWLQKAQAWLKRASESLADLTRD